MSLGRLMLALACMVLLAVGVNGWLVGKALHKGDVAVARNCESIGTIAKIERRLIQGQSAQTAALIKTGYTFGIPKPRLEVLVAQGQVLQARFLHELDRLTRTNC